MSIFLQIFAYIGIIIYSTMLYTPTLAYAGIGCCFSEVSGVTNIGIEGIMTFGAFTGCAGAYFTKNPYIGLLIAGFTGVLLSLFHAYTSITLNADQTISGTALNLMGPGLASLFACILFGKSESEPLTVEMKVPRLFSNVFDSNTIVGNALKNIFSHYVTTYILLILIFVSWFILFRTKIGLRIRACGENPKACETLGINVIRIRYICVLISGFFAGIAGACLTMSITNQYRLTSVVGQGFIAMAAVIFGKHKPKGILFACLLFGFSQGVRVMITNGLISVNILSMLPYVITLIVLMFFSGGLDVIKSLGKPYYRGK